MKESKCDICGKPTESIVAKAFYTPAVPGNPVQHSNYTHHADVGACCQKKLLNSFRWRKRMSAQQYNESRRVG